MILGYINSSLKAQHAAAHIQSRLKVSIRVAQKYAFLLCIGGWCQPMVEVELPYLLDFL
jgi:hypothetical protein